ncbi:MAG: hypothetical protein U9R56_04540 [candidate division Zixibacteria bacterium]|nr:hypothetical protein [candidate division Zixibacteria bacterium]
MVTTIEIDDRIAKCRKILDSDPNSQIFAALAEAYRKKGDIEKAFQICQNGLKNNQSYGSAHIVMARINLDRGLYEWAEIEAKKAAECDGWIRGTELLLAEIHIYKGEFSPAIKLLKKLHESDPDNNQITKLLNIARHLPEQQAASTGITDDRQPKTTGSEETVIMSKPGPAEMSIEDILEQAHGISGVDGALYANSEGLTVESKWSLKMDSHNCGAIFGDISDSLDRELVQSCFGGVQTVLIETEEPTFYLVKDQEGMFIFIANGSANLGALRMKLDGMLKRRNRR